MAQVVISGAAFLPGSFSASFLLSHRRCRLEQEGVGGNQRCYSIITPSMGPFQRKQLPFLTFLGLASWLPNLLPVPREGAGAAWEHPWVLLTPRGRVP